jgi:amino acid permease
VVRVKKCIFVLSLIIIGLTSFIIQGFLIKPNNQKLLSNTPQIIYKTKIIYKKIPLDSSQIIVNKQIYNYLNKTANDVSIMQYSSKISPYNATQSTGNYKTNQTYLGRLEINDCNIQNFIDSNRNTFVKGVLNNFKYWNEH